MENNEKNKLTEKEQALFEKFVKSFDNLSRFIPEEPIPEEVWQKIDATHEIPEEYKDRVKIVQGTDAETGETRPFYVDSGLYHHYVEEIRIANKYRDVLTKVLNNQIARDPEKHKNSIQFFQWLLSQKSDENAESNPRSRAIERGALMSIGGRLAAYSTNDLKNALTADFIFRLPSAVDKKTAFDKSGKLNMLMLQENEFSELDDLHSAFLYFVVRAVGLATGDGNTVSWYLPSICRELGIDPRTYSNRRQNNGLNYSEMRLNEILTILAQFDPLVGRTPDGSYYRLVTFESYDKASDTITLSAPYFYRIKAIMQQRSAELKKPQTHELLHSDVANEPNHAAVELACRILTGIVDRGTNNYKKEPQMMKRTRTTTSKNGAKTTDTILFDIDTKNIEHSNTVSYTVKFSTLINDCPQLKKELEDIEKRGAKNYQEEDNIRYPIQTYNKKLKDVFTAAFRIIAEKSDAPAKYIDFELPTIQRTVKGEKRSCYDVPTKSTLRRNLIIRHKGLNPKFGA